MSKLSRRALVTSLAAAPVGLAAASVLPRVGGAQASGGPNTLPPLAQFKIGRFDVTALTDGYTDMPYGYFTGRTEAVIGAAAAGVFADRNGSVRLAFNQFLIRDGDQLVLIDTGPAGKIGETGRLPGALSALGVKPDDIDALILTHLHFDHISGAIAGGQRTFRNAEVYADRRDVVHFTDPAKRAAAPDFLKSSFEAAGELIRLYPRLNRIDGEREIARGISFVDLTGHTPGHVGVRIADEGHSLIMVSDMLFHPAVHPAAADVGFVFEQDPAAALRMRETFFPRAAEEKAFIAATHMPFPGLGRIAKDRGELRWVTANWAHQG